jgi:uncharacterized protein YlzI (FlbEa/FlbD family)
MSDVKHARDAEAHLREAKEQTEDAPHPAELALVHGVLADSRALREIDTTIRLGLKELTERVKGAPAAQLVLLEQESGHVWLNAHHIVAIHADDDDPDEQTTVSMSDGTEYAITGSVLDVSASIFQVVGSW